MTSRGKPAAGPRSLELNVDLPEGTIKARVDVPEGSMRLVEFTSSVLELSSEVAAMGERQVARQGHTVSCRKGCAACCRQLIPLAPTEAVMIAELVDNLPAEHRARVRDRFERAEDRLRETGLWNKLNLLDEPNIAEEEMVRITREYFELGLACPFLEDEACSIHALRPSVCREYLVVSPAEQCSNPYEIGITRVPISLRMSKALAELHAELFGVAPRLVPLTKALRFERDNPRIRGLGADGARLLRMFAVHLRRAITGAESDAKSPRRRTKTQTLRNPAPSPKKRV